MENKTLVIHNPAGGKDLVFVIVPSVPVVVVKTVEGDELGNLFADDSEKLCRAIIQNMPNTGVGIQNFVQELIKQCASLTAALKKISQLKTIGNYINEANQMQVIADNELKKWQI